MQRLGPAILISVFVLTLTAFAPPSPHVAAQAPAASGPAPTTVDISEVGSLELVDPGHDDVSPLAESIWSDLRVDLQAPAGFSSIYRVPGRDDLFMRASGGVFAVFPRSDYGYNAEEGVFPLIPPDTVFHLSPVTLADLANQTSTSAKAALPFNDMAALNDRIDMRLAPTPATPADRLHTGPLDPRIDLSAARAVGSAGSVSAPPNDDTAPTVPARAPRSDNWSNERPWRDPEAEPFAGSQSPAVGPAIVRDPDYRARRLRFLMRQAADSSVAY